MAEEVDVNSFIVQCGAATAEEAATACRVLEEHGLGELLKRLITSDQTQIQQLTFTLEEAKSEREILMLTSETKFHQLEKDLRVALQHLKKAESENEILGRETTARVAELADLQTALKSAELTRDDAVLLQNETQTVQRQLANEKQELLETLERRNAEIARLNEEWHRMNDRVNNASKLHSEVQVKVDDMQNKEITLQVREQRLQQEKELLESQNQWLQTELKSKAEALVSLKNESASDRVTVRTELSNKSQEAARLASLVDEMKRTMKVKDAKLEVYLDKVKQARDEKLQCEELFRKEMSAQTRLTTLYQASAEESNKRVEELITAVEELQTLHSKSVEEQREAEEQFRASDMRVGELDEMVKQMQNELDNANELLEVARQRGEAPMSEDALKELCPTAAATSSLLKSGMTLTQIYSEYVETSDALRQKEEENKHLNDYLNDILRELEEKAPILLQQKREFEEALQMNEHLSEKLREAMTECENRSDETEKAGREVGFLRRENGHLMEQVADLGHQVQILLKECEEARGGLSSTTGPLFSREENQNVSSSSQVISDRLVIFRNIEELQQQNQRLLRVVRELSDEREKAEQTQADARVVELQEQVDSAMTQLEKLRNARARQSEMVEAIVRQRDMYRVLAQSNSPAKLNASLNASDIVADSSQQIDDAAEARGALKELQSEFESYKKEKAEYSRMIESKLEEFREESSKLRLANSRLSSNLEFASERAQMQMSNADAYQREVEALRDRNHKLSDSQLKLEVSLEKSRQELWKTTENIAKLERSCDMLKLERDQLKTSETRLLQLNDGLMKEKRSQNIIIANLQTIEKNLERSEVELKTRLGGKIEDLERELSAVRREATAEREKHDDMLHLVQTQLRDAQSQLNQESKQVLHLKDQLAMSESRVESLETKECEFMEQLQRNEQQLEQLTSSHGDETDGERHVMELRAQIRALQEEKEAVNVRLSETLKRADEYKALSLANEEALQEVNRVSAEFQQSMQEKFDAAVAAEEKTKEKLADVEKRREKLTQEYDQLQKNMHEQTLDLRQSVMKLKIELEDAVAARNGAEQGELIARTECHKQARRAAEAQEKYERELTLHAADVQSLQAEKAKLKCVRDELDEARIVAADASADARQTKAVMEEKERAFREENNQLQTRLEDLQKQNGIVHEQAERLSRQLVTAQPSLAGALSGFLSGDSPSRVEADSPSKTPAQLWDIIRFLRREKQISETKCEVSEAESVRYRQRYEHLEKQLEETRTALTEERERCQMTAQTAAQHAELMQKVENLNVLQDSNRFLREEKNSLEQQVTRLVARVKWFEGEMGPLSENNRLLSAQKDTLLAEKAALKNEVDRWTARTNHLIEQCNRVDPDEYKALVEHHQQSKAKIDKLSEDFQQSQEEIMALQDEIDLLKEENAESGKTLEKLQKDIETKKQAIEKKVEQHNKLRILGRRFRAQCDEAKSELEETKKELDALKKKESEQSGGQDDSKELMAKNESLNQVIEQLKKDKQEQVAAVADRDEKLKKSQQLMKRIQERHRTLTDEKNKLQAELNAKKTASAEKDKQAEDEYEMRELVLKQQLEAKITRLEEEKRQATEKVKDWQDKYSKLLNQTLQKERETLQKKTQTQKPTISVTAPSTASQVGGAVSTTAPLVTASVVPTPATSQTTPMATVKPMPASVTRTAAIAPTAVTATSDVSSGVSQETAPAVETVAEVSGEYESVPAEEVMEQESEEPEAGDQTEEGNTADSPTSAHPGSSVKRPREEAQPSPAVKRAKVSEESLEVSESSLSMEVIPLTETSQAGIEQSQHIEISSSGQVEDSTEQHSSEAGDGMVEEGAADFSQNEGMHESSVSQGGNSEPEGSVQGWSEEHPDHGELPETTESEQVAGEDSDSEMVLEEQQSISGNEATATEPQASQSSSQTSSSQATSSLHPPSSTGGHSKSRMEQARSELPRFSFAQSLLQSQHSAQPSGLHYDESEDSTVPHTPVLHPPARNDGGFAQMIASPQVIIQPRFPPLQQAVDAGRNSLGAIATQSGLRMDDTQIDLLAPGRSYPHIHLSSQQPDEEERVHTSNEHAVGASEGQSEQMGLEADSAMAIGEEGETERMTSEVHLAPAETSLPVSDRLAAEDNIMDLTDDTEDQFEVGESSSAVAVWVDETSEANEPFVTEETNDQTVSEADVIELLSVDEVTELVGRRDEENREQEEREEGDDEESQSQSSTQEASSSSGNDGQTRAQSSGTVSGRRINIVRSTQPGRSSRPPGKPKSGD